MSEKSLQEFIAFMQMRLQHKANTLRVDALALADHMKFLAERLQRSPMSPVNGLGEVQSLGCTIDALCGEVCTLQENIKDAKALLAE